METTPTRDNKLILIAGATGSLGEKITRHLLKHQAIVRILVRKESSQKTIDHLEKLGAEIFKVDFENKAELKTACEGVSCVVSALSGLEKTMLEIQGRLLDAAVEAGIPRFIPSDYSLDYTKIPDGINRNLDFRKKFHDRINKANISATSILNGMFTDLLTGDAPLVVFPLKRIAYFGDKDQPLDFTTMEYTAEFTALAALDPSTPRYLRIAGEVSSAAKLRDSATAASGKEFKLFRIGGLKTLDRLIKFTKFVAPKNNETFPAWQGMQYQRNMVSGNGKLEPLDNDRYGSYRWTTARQVLEEHLNS